MQPPQSPQPSTSKQQQRKKDDEETLRKKALEHLKFLSFNELGTDVTNMVKQFNSFATKKTIATGFFNIALVTTNFAQLKQVITLAKNPPWSAQFIVLMAFICLSLFLQFVVAIMLVFLAKQGEFIDEEKRNALIRSNNTTTILVLIITVINIFISVFISI
jgi:hypothetical protein